MNRYEITVRGRLDARRARALGADGLRPLADGRTALRFEAIDMSATYGLIARLRDAGLELMSLEPIADEPRRPGTDGKG
jgi:hypothetical protein